jgi:hypothetical protein
MRRKFARMGAQRSKWEIAFKHLIAKNGQLQKDISFIQNKLGWSLDVLTKRVMWDAGRYSKSQAVPSLTRRAKEWKSDEYFWRTICGKVKNLAHQVQKVNDSLLSPSKYPPRLSPSKHPPKLKLTKAEVRQLAEDFHYLPEILRWWAATIRDRVALAKESYRLEKQDHKEFSRLAVETSVEQAIYAASGGFHANRLYRIYGAALSTMGAEIISPRAFVLRLGTLKKRTRKNNSQRIPAVVLTP